MQGNLIEKKKKISVEGTTEGKFDQNTIYIYILLICNIYVCA